MNALDEVLTPGEQLTYVSSIGGKPFSYHWTLYAGDVHSADPPARLHRLIFLTETLPSAVGLGGPPVRIRANLLCHANLSPSRYRVETKTSVNLFVAGEESHIILPDGSRHQVEDEEYHCIIGENLGQLALFLRLARDEVRDGFTARFFSLGGVSAFDYTLSSLPRDAGDSPRGRWFAGPFMDELLLDEEGWLARHEIPKEGVVSKREELPLPDWWDKSLREEPLVYMPPAGASFTLLDVQVPGPVVSIGTTVTVPKGEGPHPVAIFLSGSGSHDRHGMDGQLDLGSHELVDFLSEHGWLCARFDTRGTGTTKVGEDFLEFGIDEIVADARAVLRYVAALASADASRLALVGHSQGGLVALELALVEEDVRGMALLAAAARPVGEVLRDQIAVRGRWLRQTEEQVQTQVEDLEEFLRLVRAVGEWTPENVPPKFYVLKRQRKWYADLLERDPLKLIARAPCPVLICQGAKDFQVSLEKDAEALYRTASLAGVPVELAVFQNLDHLFKPVEGESHIAQYYDQGRGVADELKRRVLDFLDTHVR